MALVLGLGAARRCSPWCLNARYRRGGAHARGIVVDVTEGGELRIWGRGYGTRVVLGGAEVRERLVDVYAGRLGAWRQRRLRVRSAARGRRSRDRARHPGARRRHERGAAVEGGEGDCVELGREAYETLRAHVVAAARRGARLG